MLIIELRLMSRQVKIKNPNPNWRQIQIMYFEISNGFSKSWQYKKLK